MPSDLGEEDLKDVTVILTWRTFPKSKEICPKLKYIQLSSAGANHVLEHPLFTEESGVEFCTARGVHP